MACRLTLTAHRAECTQSFRSSVRVWAQGNATQADSKAEIYLGKGRFIEDDPSLYPTKDEWGTGGWAGGEEGLQQFIAQSQLEEAAKKEDPAKDAPSAAPGSFAKGKDTIYVGKGQYIQDDARIYPSKEDAGPLPGATGGFAGGERGLQHFIQTQSLEPAPPEVVNERQTRRDAIATVGVAAVAGASYFAYLFLTGQPLPDVPDVAQLTSASSQVSEGALDTGVPAMPGATPSFAPAVSENQIKLVATGAAVLASIVGGAVLFKKTGEVAGNAARVAKGLVEDNLARMLVVGGAIMVYYFLLM